MAAYQIEFESAAMRQFRRLPLDIQQRIRPEINTLSENPRPPGVKKLRIGNNLYRIRMEAYRVIYRINDDLKTITTMVVDLRDDAYR